MGKLADIVHEERLEVLKPAITRGEPVEGEPIFTSKDFSGFADFMGDEPQEKEQEKMMSIFSIMKMLMKMMD